MNKTFVVLFAFLFVSDLCAGGDMYIISQKAQIMFTSSYQNWQGESNEISELSFPVYFYYPFSRTLSLSIRGSQAHISGNNYKTLKGISDTQLNMSYFVESANLVLNSGLNVPSGKIELSEEEFETSRIISMNHLKFNTPNLGQGLNINLGATWAYPVSDNIVIGLGGSYQLKGAYRPLADLQYDYKPGDEILFTAGFDIAFSRQTAVSFDGVFTAYSADEYNNRKIYEAGNKIVTAFRFRHYMDYNEISLFARYRSRAKNSIPSAGVLTKQEEKSIPDNFEFNGYYLLNLNQKLSLNINADIRLYQESVLYDGIRIYGAGFGSRYRIISNWDVVINFRYYKGNYINENDFAGIEVVMSLGYVF